VVGLLYHVAHVGMCKAAKDLKAKSWSRVTMTEKRLREEIIEKAMEMGRWVPPECPASWTESGGVLDTLQPNCGCIATSSSMHGLLGQTEPEENDRILDL
jgi:hypothetical protein